MKKYMVTIVIVVLIALAVVQAVQINSLKEKAPKQAVGAAAVVADVDGDVAGADPVAVVAPDAAAPVAVPDGEE